MSGEQGAFLGQLRDYPKRENRQGWSSYYHRMRSSKSELFEDPEVISDASLEGASGSSGEYLYTYSDGEIKLRLDSRVEIFSFYDGAYEDTQPIRGARLKFVDPLKKKVVISFPVSHKAPVKICIMPASPLNSRSIGDSIARYAASPSSFPSARRLLNREPSLFKEKRTPLTLSYNDEKVDETVRKAVNLDLSHMTVQGPPGTGKTYVGARIILELILQGRRVGVMALSHKAINNLLLAVDTLLDTYSVKGAELVKSRSRDTGPETFKNIRIGDVVNSVHKSHLIGGTIYNISRLPDNILDTLVIDEAGQIPLAWVMAAGRTAKNIILLGDHKQLPQVSQSLHPEGSGESVLEHLMAESDIIDESFGVFLNITRRMNGEITQFVSELMYDGQLKPHQENETLKLGLKDPRNSSLDDRGLSWIEMEHKNCSQESREEATEVQRIIQELHEKDYPLSEVLVIAPYRAQEALLRSVLPKSMDEQIGTVDRFQGREADIVIFSMTSSDANNLPRDIDFLYSVKRLNVAVSRARKKAIVIANKPLLTIPVSNLEQLKLVNALCKFKHACQKALS